MGVLGGRGRHKMREVHPTNGHPGQQNGNVFLTELAVIKALVPTQIKSVPTP